MFVNRANFIVMFLVVYIDDIVLTGKNAPSIYELKDYLRNSFDIKDLGSLHYFLGMKVVCSS